MQQYLKKLSFCLLWLTLASCAVASEVWIPAASVWLEGRVVRVADGDTVTILDAQNKQHRVRLAFIDAPEKNQKFGHDAKRALSDWVFKKTVRVRVMDHDRYGRVVGQLFVQGRDVNLALLEAGWVWHYTFYAKNQDRADFVAYQTAQTQARQAQRGLWQDAAPQAPWDFRRARR